MSYIYLLRGYGVLARRQFLFYPIYIFYRIDYFIYIAFVTLLIINVLSVGKIVGNV